MMREGLLYFNVLGKQGPGLWVVSSCKFFVGLLLGSIHL